jgi:hypothetical protein
MRRMRFWPPGLHPAVAMEENIGVAGSARHPTIAPGGARPTGHQVRSRRVMQVVPREQPDPYAVQLAGSMAIATNTRSPMADNGNVFRGDPGFAVNRFAGKLAQDHPEQTFGGNIRPITYPNSIRVGMQSGPSSQPAFPGTGTDASLGSVALMNGAVLGWTVS